jgi:hypothetical protein
MRIVKPLSMLVALVLSGAAFAASNSPWVNAEGESELTLTYGSQTADRFFAGDAEMDLPADLDQDTLTLAFSYGLNDLLTLDAQIGYAESDFIVNPVLSPRGGLDGIQDSRLGLRLNVAGPDRDLPTITLGLAALFRGNYDTGALSAIGDGETGLEAQVAVGHYFDQGVALSGGLAYRNFNGAVPSQTVFNLGGGYGFTEQFSGGLFYQNVSSSGDLDIGAPGFSPARFPEVDEDYSLFGVSGSFAFTDAIYLSADLGRKNDGRNTAKSRFWQLSLGRTF